MSSVQPFRYRLLSLAAFCLLTLTAHGAGPVHLRCEYVAHPLAVDRTAPRLSWQSDSTDRDARQSAYRILVASNPALLAQDQGDLWDTGKVVGDQSTQLPYAGRPLSSREPCYWKVMTWDKSGAASPWSSEPASWEMGLLHPDDWQPAAWIRLGTDTRNSPLSQRMLQTGKGPPHARQAFPSPLFRREFQVARQVARARVYVCGLGYCELYLNGQKVGDAVLDPGMTTYDVRAFYVAHDVTSQLKPGQNAMGLWLGNGFFGQTVGFNTTSLGWAAPTVIAKLVIDYTDGTSEVIATDKSWRAETGPVVFDNVYVGESYDATHERKGWAETKFDDSSWQGAIEIPSPTKQLEAQMIPPIKRILTLPTQSVTPIGGNNAIFDFGQNIAGWVKLKVNEPAGTQITLRFSEVLMPGGKELDTASTGTFATGSDQVCIYICKGDGVETWEPRFTYHGFRYVEMTGLTRPPAADALEAVMVRTAFEANGSFQCSDDLLNKIYRTSMWTIEDNRHSVPEDCPHREKCAWLGDAHATAETDMDNFDVAQFWTKFEDDMETVLGRGGETYLHVKAAPGIPPNIAVGKRLCQEARPDWGVASVLIPWDLYRYYGDTDVLARHYDTMKRWVDYIAKKAVDHIVMEGYGDWCPPGGNKNIECPVPLSSTAYQYGALRIMHDVAMLLGKTDDATAFAAEADATQTAFLAKFYSEQNAFGSQTADGLALRFDLAPPGREADVARALAGEVTQKHGGHPATGIHGSRPLFMELNDYNYDQLTYDMMKLTTYPSYGYMLARGYTTWPETQRDFQPGDRYPDGSDNHPMQSSFALWFQESVGGIRPAAPGFKQIELKPHNYRQLAWAEATHDSPYGLIRSRWKRDSAAFTWDVTVPANTSATAYLPAQDAGKITEGGAALAQVQGAKFLRMEGDRAVVALGSGTYHFTSQLPPK